MGKIIAVLIAASMLAAVKETERSDMVIASVKIEQLIENKYIAMADMFPRKAKALETGYLYMYENEELIEAGSFCTDEYGIARIWLKAGRKYKLSLYLAGRKYSCDINADDSLVFNLLIWRDMLCEEKTAAAMYQESVMSEYISILQNSHEAQPLQIETKTQEYETQEYETETAGSEDTEAAETESIEAAEIKASQETVKADEGNGLLKKITGFFGTAAVLCAICILLLVLRRIYMKLL